jgi:hypothetical protein
MAEIDAKCARIDVGTTGTTRISLLSNHNPEYSIQIRRLCGAALVSLSCLTYQSGILRTNLANLDSTSKQNLTALASIKDPSPNSASYWPLLAKCDAISDAASVARLGVQTRAVSHDPANPAHIWIPDI